MRLSHLNGINLEEDIPRRCAMVAVLVKCSGPHFPSITTSASPRAIRSHAIGPVLHSSHPPFWSEPFGGTLTRHS